MKIKPWAFALAGSLALAGCLGDSDNDDTPAATSQVPALASQSVDNFIGYLRRLVVASADTLEPVDVSAVTPPVDDTGSPTSVD